MKNNIRQPLNSGWEFQCNDDPDWSKAEVLFIGYGFHKIKKSRSNGISSGYILGYLSATSINSLVLGMLLATYSSPFLVADSVTVALNEVMTFNHWLCFIIGLILIIKGFVSAKKNN